MVFRVEWQQLRLCDQDGRVDLRSKQHRFESILLKNVTQQAGHWPELKLVGDAQAESAGCRWAVVYVTRKQDQAATGRRKRDKLRLTK